MHIKAIIIMLWTTKVAKCDVKHLEFESQVFLVPACEALSMSLFSEPQFSQP